MTKTHQVKIGTELYQKARLIAALLNKSVQDVINEAVVDLVDDKYQSLLKNLPCPRNTNSAIEKDLKEVK
jgi:hypothetical protein